jgi:RNA polymerase sigma factor (sigma-70 family)
MYKILSMDDFYLDRTFRNYYSDVGKYDILSSEEEREYLIRYNTCPTCKRRLPQVIKVRNCPSCGGFTPKRYKHKGNVCVCIHCSKKYMRYMPPVCCPQCGSGRDMEARERLVVSNLRFVIKTAKRFTSIPEQVQKLSSAGNIGLIIALDKFNLRMYTKFLTYAAWWIRKEMLDELHNSGLVHIPSHKQKSINRERKLGEYACVHCGIRTSNIHNGGAAIICLEDKHEFIPVDGQETASNTIFPLDNIQLTADDNLEEQTIADEAAKILKETLHSIKMRSRDRFIMLQYHNVPENDRRTECKTLPQLAAITGITPERVRQIKVRVQKEVLKELKKRNVQDYSDIGVAN